MNPTAWLRNVVTLFVTCMREIFDESAYMRFLQQRRMRSSPEAYAEFSKDRAATMTRRPRCC
jgi:hypothetical protein